jgi:desampylase
VPAGVILRIPQQIRQAIEVHAQACHPEECCGLLALDGDGRVRFSYATTNIDHSPTSYTIDPVESYHVFTHAERNGWDISGAFHSHPNGPDALSQRDLDEGVEGWFYVVAGPKGIGCWLVREGKAERVSLAE